MKIAPRNQQVITDERVCSINLSGEEWEELTNNDDNWALMVDIASQRSVDSSDILFYLDIPVIERIRKELSPSLADLCEELAPDYDYVIFY